MEPHGVIASEAFVGLLVAGAAAAGVLVALAAAVYLRRRERSTLLVVLAFLALFARTAVALLAVRNAIPTDLHHVLEHGLDVVMAALVVAAVYYARRVERGVGEA